GACVAVPVDCGDDDKCTADGCDPLVGCVYPPADVCGDGELDEACGEVCDDGNRADGDGCRADCSAAGRCGDGVVQVLLGETCDDGAGNSDVVPDACRTDCRRPRCGDGVLDRLEGCDDGPANSAVLADACRPVCRPAYCGDGVRDAGEGCDDGNANSEDGCSDACAVERCGDGVLQVLLGETCDDGNLTAGDGCDAACAREVCGDGVVQGALGEVCDDGAAGSDTCTPDCKARVCSAEICDAKDNDCDDAVDEGCSPNNAIYTAMVNGQPVPAVKTLPPACDSPFDCNDENIFTTDHCTNGRCSWTHIGCDGPDADRCLDGRTQGSNANCVDRGPRLIWDFEVATTVPREAGQRLSGQVIDTSGENRNGVIEVRAPAGQAPLDPIGSAGRFGGRGLQLTGGQAGHVARNMTVPPTDFTLSAWFRTTHPAGGLFGAVGKDAIANERTVCGVTTRTGFIGHSAIGDPLTPTDREVYLKNGRLAYRVAPGATSRCEGQGPLVNDDQWHLATLVCRSAQHCRLYVDAQQVCESSPFDARSGLAGQHQLALGWTQAGGFFGGSLDQFTFYDYAMGPNEVADLLGGVNAPGKGDNLERCDGIDNDCDGALDESCDDGDASTVGERCQAGACVAPAVAPCPSDPCVRIVRDPASGLCERELDATLVGAGCDDGVACTVNDACNALGLCVGTPLGHCDDGVDRAFFDRNDPHTILFHLADGADHVTALTPVQPNTAGFGTWGAVPGAPNTWRHTGLIRMSKAQYDQGAMRYVHGADTFMFVPGEITTGLNDPFTLSGTVGIPWTTTGFFGQLGVPGIELPTLGLGYQYGAALQSLGAPLQDDTRYLYLRGAAQIGLTLPNAPTIPLVGPSVTAVVD
ncbi:MAG: hypothetical protein KC583_15460, partial [Myxococcales bacterium]|nr:hypothetical protein [Myxococcales bacterium]